jgi:hypothetical protein
MVTCWVRSFAVGALLICSTSISNAADQPLPAESQPLPDQTLGRWAVGLNGGTLGIGGEVSAYVNSFLVLRATATWLKFDPSSLLSDLSSSDNGYNFSLSQIAAGGLVDLHPFRNGFRVVAGIEYADFNFRQSVSAQSSYTINGTNYTSAQIGNLYTNVSIKNEAAPYIGVGWDSAFYCGYIAGTNTAAKCDQFTIGFDVGALYTGGVNVTQTTDRTVAGLATDLAAESGHLQNTFNEFYSFYPVVMVNAKYRF